MLSSINLFRNLRIPPHAACKLAFSTAAKKENLLEFQNNYDNKQITRILNTVNTQSEIDLGHFNISKQRIRKIELRKQKQGEFKTLEDILELDGFGIKVLEKFCDSILSSGNQENVSDKKSQEDSTLSLLKKKQSYVTPTVLEGFRNSITSCVALHVDLNYIAWTKLSLAPDIDDESSGIRQIAIDEWMCYQIGNDDKKQSLSDLIQILTQLNEKIPSADVYVVEAQQSPQVAKQPGNPIQVNVNVQKAQLIAMMCMLMASRNPLDKYPEKKKPADLQRVFFLRTFLASRLYKTYIGNERVSTEHVIEDIFRNSMFEDKAPNPTLNAIDVPRSIKDFYNSNEKIEREFMGQSMLIGLTFLKLCVLKCAQCVKLLNKRSNQN